MNAPKGVKILINNILAKPYENPHAFLFHNRVGN
jgi:hypothetical protein